MSAVQTIIQKCYEISRKMIKTEGYSKKSKELALERIEHLKEHSKLLLHERKQKVKQLSRQTNALRKKQEDRKKSKEDEEEDRRQKILKSRKLKQRIATEKFQRCADQPKKEKNKRQGSNTGLRDGLYNVRGHVIEIKNGIRVGSSKQKETSKNYDVVADNQLVMSPIFQNALYSRDANITDHLSSMLGDMKDDRDSSIAPPNAIKSNYINDNMSDWNSNYHNKTETNHQTYNEVPSNDTQNKNIHIDAMNSSPRGSTGSVDSLNEQLNLRSSLKGMNIKNLSDSIERKVTFSNSIYYNDGCSEPLITKITDRIPFYKRLQNNLHPKEKTSDIPVARTTEETLDQLRQDMLIPLYPKYNDYNYPESVNLSDNPHNVAVTNPSTSNNLYEGGIKSVDFLKHQNPTALNAIQNTSNTQDCLETKHQRTNSISDEEFFDSLAEDLTNNEKLNIPTNDVFEENSSKYNDEKSNVDMSTFVQNNNHQNLKKQFHTQNTLIQANTYSNNDQRFENPVEENPLITQQQQPHKLSQGNEISSAQLLHNHHAVATASHAISQQNGYGYVQSSSAYSLSYVSQPIFNNSNLNGSANGSSIHSARTPSYSPHYENSDTISNNFRSEQYYYSDIMSTTLPSNPITWQTSHMMEYPKNTTIVDNNTRPSVNSQISQQKFQPDVTTVYTSTFPHTDDRYNGTTYADSVAAEPSYSSQTCETRPFLQNHETGKQFRHSNVNKKFHYDNSDSNSYSDNLKNNFISNQISEKLKPSDQIYDDIEKSLAGLTFENSRTKREEIVASPRPKVIPQGDQQPYDQVPSQKHLSHEFTSPRNKADKITDAVRDGTAIPIRIHSNTTRRGRIIVSATKRKPATGFAPHPPQNSKNENKDVSIIPQENIHVPSKYTPNYFHKRSASANAIVSKKPPLMAKQRQYSNSAIKQQSRNHQISIENQQTVPYYEGLMKTHPNSKNLNTPSHQIPLDKTPTDDEINKLWKNVRECLSTEAAEHGGSDVSNVNPSSRHQRSFSGSSYNRMTSNIVYKRQNSSDSMSSTSSFSRRQPLLPHRASKIFVNPGNNDTSVGNPPKGSGTASSKYQEVTSSMATFLTLEEMCTKETLENKAPATFQISRQFQKNRYPGATALSVEEKRVMQSLERLNLKLKEQERKLQV